MYIKGTEIKKCGLCERYVKENGKGICELTNLETDEKNTCAKFIYDIFKYKPKKQFDAKKYKKEDFEI